MYIAVIGPDAEATSMNRQHAYEVGHLLAERGVIVVTGGLGGVMECAARGCSDADGMSVGLLPGRDRRYGSQPHAVALPTGLGELRNALVVGCADGVIAIGGSWGTLSELALAQRNGVRVVSLNGWGVVDEAGRPLEVETAISPRQAVDRIIEVAGGLLR
jgi:uncharacterized protein (TIGR00725 family)